MKIVVLGAGLVGAPMALDLAVDHEVTVADISEAALARLGGKTATVQADLSDPEAVRRVVGEADFVLSAVPGFMGYRTLETLIRAGKNVVDIAFFAEDPLSLDALAKEKGVTVLVDMGVAPGMSSVLAGSVTTELDETTSILTYVGGLPLVRRWPYEYAAVFSPVDVIEEYVRPARYVENGSLVVRPALSDAEHIDFPGVGTLEVFNTDGLRTMATTFAHVPNMKEKTMRWPGHIEKMVLLRETGFFGTDPIDVGGVKVRPVDVTAKLLFPMWKLGPDEIDITVLRVIVEGKKNGAPVRRQFDLVDRARDGVHSMARTTGYTATSGIRLLANELFDKKGVFPPELIGLEKRCVAFLRSELEKRHVIYVES